MGDLLDHTAQQVRLDYKGASVHRLTDTRQDVDGPVYTARCGDTLAKANGAILTTQPVSCSSCWSGRP